MAIAGGVRRLHTVLGSFTMPALSRRRRRNYSKSLPK
jgi:hypothetical protein